MKSKPLLLLLPLLRPISPQLLPTDDPTIDYYCGISWREANAICSLPCPSGNDTDCPPNSYGRKRRCYASSGCAARTEMLDWYGVISLTFDGTHEKNVMSEEVMSDFSSSVQQFMTEAMNTMEISCVDVLEQEYDRPCIAAVIPRRLTNATYQDDYYCGISWSDASSDCRTPCPSKLDDDCPDATQCYAATGCVDNPSSTSLDLEIKLCGVYIPQLNSVLITPQDFENDILNIVSHREKAVVSAISSSSPFFTALTGVAALSNDNVAEAPSSFPSIPPSRPLDVDISTYIDSKPSGSYGIFFDLRTTSNASTVLLTGMSFVTAHEGMLEYEIYTRLGTHVGYEGVWDEWELIAKASTVGSGPFNYTRVLEDVPTDDDLGYLGFTSLHVPGGGGVRSFHVTLTDRYAMEDGSPVPLSFLSSLVEESECTRVYEVVERTEELEILEGDGVLGGC
jgi:hypothetical protein